MQHYCLTGWEAEAPKSPSTQEQASNMLFTYKTIFPLLGHFSNTQESITTTRVPKSHNTCALGTLVGVSSDYRGTCFMPLKDMDVFLMQGIFNLELHQSAQTNSDNGIELCDLKIKPGYIVKDCNCCQGGTSFNHSVKHRNSLIKILSPWLKFIGATIIQIIRIRTPSLGDGQ